MTPADRRAAVVREALAVVGLGAHDPEPYLDLVGPGESAAIRAAMLTMSGCALVAAGVLRRAGLDAPELAPPYRIGTAVSRLMSLAVHHAAWRSDRHMLPGPGDIVLVRAPEHVFIVVEPTQLDLRTASLVSVDGGQLDAQGRQVVRQRVRRWTLGERWRDRARDDGAAQLLGAERAVYGWIDVGALPLRSAEEQVYGT